jgi:cardiolipin synthase
VNLPNFITLGRLLAVPVEIWLVLSGELTAAFALFVLAGLSDGVDGYIAKRFDQRTELGALLDPIADKALLVSLFVTLGLSGHLPNWLVILVVFRDVLIVGGFLLGSMLGGESRARPLLISKANTGFQILLVAYTLARLGLGFADRGVGTVLTYLVAATTVLSGAAYLVRWARTLAGMEAPK